MPVGGLSSSAIHEAAAIFLKKLVRGIISPLRCAIRRVIHHLLAALSISYSFNMICSSPKSHRQTPWRLLLCLLCLALVVIGSTVQVAHTHPGGDISHADCSLCATAHVVAQVVSNPVPLPATMVIEAVEEARPHTQRAPLPIFALFTRPPPSVSNLA